MDESQEVVPAEVSAPEQVATAVPESEVDGQGRHFAVQMAYRY